VSTDYIDPFANQLPQATLGDWLYYPKTKFCGLVIGNKEVERVQVESIVSSGKAIYMPGSVCILKATSEVSEDKMREFAAACIKSHKDWLLISNDASNYNDAPEQTPSK
jgi:hypothetical protein